MHRIMGRNGAPYGMRIGGCSGDDTGTHTKGKGTKSKTVEEGIEKQASRGSRKTRRKHKRNRHAR